MRSRCYRPDGGRFINADIFLGKQNGLLGHGIFAYCLNKPIEMCDHDGRSVGGAIAFGFSKGRTYQNYLRDVARNEYDIRVRELYRKRIEEEARLEERKTIADGKGISLEGVPLNLMPQDYQIIERGSFTKAGSSIRMRIDTYNDEVGTTYVRLSSFSWSIPDEDFEKVDFFFISASPFRMEQYDYMLNCTRSGSVNNIGAENEWVPTELNLSSCTLSAYIYFKDGSHKNVIIGADNITPNIEALVMAR